ncbi:hypothetical protein ABH931_007544 [Streptacidiphilus sp. MAP12-33]|uniref:hypothetical protein n=1 Tax=Streptacidiphilus sp. MAP12-33 TaxID=3156266 RepID=UPI0035184196
MHRGFAVLGSALAVASPAALGLTAPAHPAATQLLSCAVSSHLDFSPGVQMVSVPQSVTGVLHGSGPTTGPACTTTAAATTAGIAGLDATLTGKGQATCFTDTGLETVNLSGTMTISWKKATGEAAGSSQIQWTAKQVDLGNVVLAGTVSSGQFKGATLSVAGPTAAAVTSLTGGCAPSSPLTDVTTTDTYLRLTQA